MRVSLVSMRSPWKAPDSQLWSHSIWRVDCCSSRHLACLSTQKKCLRWRASVLSRRDGQQLCSFSLCKEPTPHFEEALDELGALNRSQKGSAHEQSVLRYLRPRLLRRHCAQLPYFVHFYAWSTKSLKYFQRILQGDGRHLSGLEKTIIGESSDGEKRIKGRKQGVAKRI